jgi:hypothetical protein
MSNIEKLSENINNYWSWFKKELYKDIKKDRLSRVDIYDYLNDCDNIYMSMHYDNILNIFFVLHFLNDICFYKHKAEYYLYNGIINSYPVFDDIFNNFTDDELGDYYANLEDMINMKKISLMGKNYSHTFINKNGEKKTMRL